MSENELSNLIFLLEASQETLSDWWEKTTEEDHKYAAELLDTYSERILEYKLNARLRDSEWYESQEVLGRIMYEA